VAARVQAAAEEERIAAAAAAEASLARLAQLSARVNGLTEVLCSRNEYERAAARGARLTLSVAALAEALQRRGAATQEVAAVRAAAGEECAIVARALRSLPASVHAPSGVPRLPALQADFRRVSEAGRRAPPPGTGLLGRALSLAGATVVLPTQRTAASASALVAEGASRVGAAVRSGAETVKGAAAEENAPHPALAPLYRGVGAVVRAVEGGAAAAGGALAGALEGAWAAVAGAVKGAADSAAAAVAGGGGGGAPTTPAPGEGGGAGGVAAALPAALAATAQAKLAEGRAVFGEAEVRLRTAASVFDAAEEAVRRGDIARACEALQTVKEEQGQEAARAWVEAAQQRIATDNAMRLVRARLDLEIAALY
jgi:hypothetical protein